MTDLIGAIDLLLGVTLVVLAVNVTRSRSLNRAVVIFMSFGLLAAVIWARLRASDLALAEAAIGAGVTGALFLDALGRLQRRPADSFRPSSAVAADPAPAPHARSHANPALTARPTWMAAAAASGLCAALAGAIASLPASAPGLAGEVARRLPESGTASPVTAVLINFRGYDTLLECTVLLIAVLGVGAIGISRRPGSAPPTDTGAHQEGTPAPARRRETSVSRSATGPTDTTSEVPRCRHGWRRETSVSRSATGPTDRSPLLGAFIRLVVPVMILWAGWMLWAGGRAAGGAFQAGAVLGALGVLLQIGGIRLPPASGLGWWRAVLVSGTAAFIAAGAVGWLTGGAFLQMPVRLAGGLILTIEAAGTLAIAAILTTLFAGRSVDDPITGPVGDSARETAGGDG